jgi:nitrogen fixation protein FixH
VTAATRWTLAIVAILSIAVGSAVTLAVIALRSGHSRVISDYYEKSTHYDSNIAEATASKRLGWRTELALVDGWLRACVTDATDQPVIAQVHVSIEFRNDSIGAIAGDMTDLAQGGCYRIAVGPRRGWYDLVVRAQRGADRFVATASLEQL